jgi:FlaG/FlaF family flagellin (archaellin)
MGRAVSSVVGVVVLVGLVVVLAGTVGVAATGLAGADEPVPTVDAQAHTFVAGCPGCGPDDQIISIEHRGGDPVEVATIEVHTAFADRQLDSRLVGLPVENRGCNDLQADDYEGADIYEGGCTGVWGALDGSDDGTWTSGEVLAFRIPKSDVLVRPGEEVTVTVVDEQRGAVVTEHTLEATDGEP